MSTLKDNVLEGYNKLLGLLHYGEEGNYATDYTFDTKGTGITLTTLEVEGDGTQRMLLDRTYKQMQHLLEETGWGDVEDWETVEMEGKPHILVKEGEVVRYYLITIDFQYKNKDKTIISLIDEYYLDLEEFNKDKEVVTITGGTLLSAYEDYLRNKVVNNPDIEYDISFVGRQTRGELEGVVGAVYTLDKDFQLENTLLGVLGSDMETYVIPEDMKVTVSWVVGYSQDICTIQCKRNLKDILKLTYTLEVKEHVPEPV